MTEYRPPLDAVAVVVAALEAGSTAPAVNGDVGGKLPRGFTPKDRAVRVTRTGGTPIRQEHLDRPRVQIEAFGSSGADAFDVVRLALVDVMALRGADVEGGFVSEVRTSIGPRDQPDDSTNPAAPRVLVEVVLFCHPIGS